MQLNTINGKYTPRYFLTDGEFAVFVEGFTSDEVKDWRLRVAPTLPNGQPDMRSVDYFWLFPWPEGSALFSNINTVSSVELTILVGNTQRLCEGLPKL